jgi:hypothetical protein
MNETVKVIFFVLPIFYGITSEGLYELPAQVRRAACGH